jgi:putative PIN family toxin of toxin-antitoxin system
VLRVVLDTSVLISSLLKSEGVPAQVFAAWRALRYVLVTSQPIIDEFKKTSGYARIRRKYHLTDPTVEEFAALLRDAADVVTALAELSDVDIRDPNDLMILATAASGEADIIVTSDKDLLVLGAFREIPILTPRQFLELLEEI